MKIINLPYGKSNLPLSLPASFRVDVVRPKAVQPCADPAGEVRRALKKPLAGFTLPPAEKVQSVAVAINDKTRPVPHDILLPALLSYLEENGIARDKVTFYIATGTHVPMPAEEFEKILPASLIPTINVVSHDCDDEGNLLSLGVTQRGIPVSVNRRFYESDLKLVVGNIEPHHFAGFSGGYKTASIGVTGRETINRNHILLLDPLARVGEFDRNPLRQDIEEIGRMLGIHAALNVVMTPEKEIIRVFFGSPVSVMQHGIPEVRAISQTEVAQPYDLVIGSAGGYPKDINLYQAQKGLTHSALIAKPGAPVVLVAECNEGHGSAPLMKFLQDVSSVDGIMEKFKRLGFQVGPHKAYQIAAIARRHPLYLVSSLDAATTRRLLFEPLLDVQESLQPLLEQLPAGGRIAVLPKAVNTIPLLALEETCP